MKLKTILATAAALLASTGAWATTFTWTGASGDGKWATAGNWTVPETEEVEQTVKDEEGNVVYEDDGVTEKKETVTVETGNQITATTLPTAADTTIFGSSTEVTLTDTTPVSNIVMAANSTLTINGNGKYVTNLEELGGKDVEGDKVVLNDVKLETINKASGSTTTWYADIEVAGGASVTNYFYCKGADDGSNVTRINYYGNLTGSGNLRLGVNGKTKNGALVVRGGTSLYGDNTEFSGVCIIDSGASTRGPVTFATAASGSESARWVYTGSAAKNSSARAGGIAFANSTIKFGTYEGTCNLVGASSDNSKNTLEIGARNIDFECSLSMDYNGSANRAVAGTTLRKVGTGTMTFTDKAGNPDFYYYEMAAGTLKFDTGNVLTSQTGGSTYQDSTFTFTGGAVAFGENAVNSEGAMIDISKYIKNSTSAIVVDVAEEQELTWATALASSNTAGLTKKGAGTLILTAVPKYTGKTTVEAGTLLIPNGTTLTDVEIAEGATVGCSSGINYGVTITTDEETGVTTVVAERKATTYTYVGEATCNLSALKDITNLKNGDDDAVLAPNTLDTIIINDALTVNLDSEVSVAAFVLNADVTLTSETSVPAGISGETIPAGMRANSFSGEGKLILGDNALVEQCNAEAAISCPVEITAADDKPAALMLRTSNLSLNVTGKLTGSGKVNCVNGSQVNSTGVKFSCDSSEFAGTIEVIKNHIDRNFSAFDYICDLSKAKVIAAFAGTTGKMFTNYANGRTFKFGSLSGYVYQEASNLSNNQHAYIEIGALNLDDSLTGTLVSHSTRSPYLRKIGTGTLTSAVKGVDHYILNGGTLVLTTDATTIDTETPVTTELEGYTVVATKNYDDDGETLVSTTYTLAAASTDVTDGTYTISSEDFAKAVEGTSWTKDDVDKSCPNGLTVMQNIVLGINLVSEAATKQFEITAIYQAEDGNWKIETNCDDTINSRYEVVISYSSDLETWDTSTPANFMKAVVVEKVVDNR